MRLSAMQRMEPVEFEEFVATLFRDMGYRVESTRASGDEGIDLWLRRGRRTAVVQCKRYRGRVGQPVVRDLYGTMRHVGADEAYLVTTGHITRAARRWAQGKPIHLVDGARLVEWARTRRLRHDRPSSLAQSRRQWVHLVGLVLLAVLAVTLVQPPSLDRLRAGWERLFPMGTPPVSGPWGPVPQPPVSPVPSSTVATPWPSPTPSLRTPLPGRPAAPPIPGPESPEPGPPSPLTPVSPGNALE